MHRSNGVQAPLALGALLLQDVVVATPARLILPFFATSKRPEAPLWVFIFGMRLLRVLLFVYGSRLAARE
jgi:hypothetical protein